MILATTRQTRLIAIWLLILVLAVVGYFIGTSQGRLGRSYRFSWSHVAHPTPWVHWSPSVGAVQLSSNQLVLSSGQTATLSIDPPGRWTSLEILVPAGVLVRPVDPLNAAEPMPSVVHFSHLRRLPDGYRFRLTTDRQPRLVGHIEFILRR